MPEAKYRLFRRASGVFYQEDNETRAQVSLRTKDKKAAQEKLRAANHAVAQPRLNLDLARVYLRAHDVEITERKWTDVMTAYTERGRDSSRERCQRAFAGHDFDHIRGLPLLSTKAEDLLKVLATGKSSVNHYLRRLVHHAEDLNWLPWSIMARKAWPRIEKPSKRGVTAAEHARIVDDEPDEEWRHYYEMLWLTGGSQTDIARLDRTNIHGEVLSYQRAKLRKDASPACCRIGPAMRALLGKLPQIGMLFPKIAAIKEKHRATHFSRRCRRLGIVGISPQSYRYGWAGRAAQAGYPQRFAQAALGHKSAAVHDAYARHAVVTVPSLEQFESANLIPFPNAKIRTNEDRAAG